jgi:hypothetical protein
VSKIESSRIERNEDLIYQGVKVKKGVSIKGRTPQGLNISKAGDNRTELTSLLSSLFPR